METCLIILYRVLRYLLKSAIIVCLMRHIAVQTFAARFSGGGGHTYELLLGGYTRGL